MARGDYLLCQCSTCKQSQVADPDTNQIVSGCLIKRSTRLMHEKQEQGLKFPLRGKNLKEDEAVATLSSQIAQLRIRRSSNDSPSPAGSKASHTSSTNPTIASYEIRTQLEIGRLRTCLFYPSGCL